MFECRFHILQQNNYSLSKVDGAGEGKASLMCDKKDLAAAEMLDSTRQCSQWKDLGERAYGAL